MSETALQQRYLAAIALAGEAGALALGHFNDGDRRGAKLKGFQDFVTETDGAVESLLRRRIADMFPSDGFFGEESGGAAAEHLWVVDPIDGTANFARGDPLWCVSIGFVRRGTPEIGVVLAPVLGETFAARRRHGVTRNGRPIRAAATQEMRAASIEIGWSPRRPAASYVSLIGRVMDLGGAVRRSGSGALGMAWVAAGRSDAYLELHINSWDVVAGFVLAREAGAVVSDYFSGDWLGDGNPILAAAPVLASDLADVMSLDQASLLPAEAR